MKNASLLKLIATMVLIVVALGGAVWLTSSLTSKPAANYGGASLSTNSISTAVGVKGGTKDWASLLSGAAKQMTDTQQSEVKPLTDSQMKAAANALNKSSQTNLPVNSNFSRESTSAINSSADRASKAFEQMGQNKLTCHTTLLQLGGGFLLFARKEQ